MPGLDPAIVEAFFGSPDPGPVNGHPGPDFPSREPAPEPEAEAG